MTLFLSVFFLGTSRKGAIISSVKMAALVTMTTNMVASNAHVLGTIKETTVNVLNVS